MLLPCPVLMGLPEDALQKDTHCDQRGSGEYLAGKLGLTAVVPGEAEQRSPRTRPIPARLSLRGGAAPVGSSNSLDQAANDHVEYHLTWQQHFFLVLEEPDSSRLARLFSHLVLSTIVLSITCFVLQTVPSIQDLRLWGWVEIGTFAIFTVEYALRFGLCTAFNDQTRCQFMKAPGNIVDLMAIFPVYLIERVEALKAFRVLRAIRLIRIFRVFKLSKYSLGVSIMVESMINSARPLSVLGFILSIGVMLQSSLVFNAERLFCPDIKEMSIEDFQSYREECDDLGTGWSKGGELCCNEYGSADDFPSIPESFWWTIVTMCTVGYGDKVPRTIPGRLVGCMAMITGIVLISLPVAIVGGKFQQAYEEMEDFQTSFAEIQPNGFQKSLARRAPSLVASPDTSPTASLAASSIASSTVTQSEKAQKSINKVLLALAVQPSPRTCQTLSLPIAASGAATPLSPAGRRPGSAVLPVGIVSQLQARRAFQKTTLQAASNEAKLSTARTLSPPATPRCNRATSLLPEALRRATPEDLAPLSAKLRKLEGNAKMSGAAQEQIQLLLEMLEHIEQVDSRLKTLREEDASLDIRIRTDFTAFSQAYNVHVAMQSAIATSLVVPPAR